MPAHQLRDLSLSSSRPTNEDAGRGRFVLEIVLRSGKRSSPSWKIATGPAKSFSRCSPRWSRRRPATPAWPPTTTPAHRAPRPRSAHQDGRPRRRNPLPSEAPRRCAAHPDPDQAGLERPTPRSPSSDCRPRIGEYIEERIALRVNLDTARESLVHSQQLPTEAARILRGHSRTLAHATVDR
jgi:hypothetical protein